MKPAPDLLEKFRFQYRNWDALCPEHPAFLTEPFKLSRAEHSQIVSISERMHKFVRSAAAQIISEPGAGALLGLDAWTVDAIRSQSRSRRLPDIARYDFFKTTEGWKISEINNDVPSGFNESSCLAESLVPDIGWEYTVSPVAKFVDLIRKLRIKKLAMVYGTAYAEDLQVCLFLRDRLEKIGCESLLASPAHLEMSNGKPHFWGERVDAIYRVYPVEWFTALPNRAQWEELLRSDVPLLNPLGTIVPQSKLFFAALHRHAPGRTAGKEWSDLCRHVPLTQAFEAADLERTATEKDRWVLKPVFGRMGYGITLGPVVAEDVWLKALGEAAKKPEAYCLQEFFRVKTEDFSVGSCYPCIGAFVINGKFAGYFTRVSLTPLTTYEAMDVATVIERA